jgi:hypothetical protein
MLAHRTRRTEAYAVRKEAAKLAALRAHPNHLNNGEESDYRNPSNQPSYVANFSKALPHTRPGEVARDAYLALLQALYSGDPDHFEQIPMGRINGLDLTNPQAGLAFDLEGPDAQAVTMPPAPRIDSLEGIGEMGELYWMALLRDVSFIDYANPGAGTNAGLNTTADAVLSLNAFRDFRGPKQGAPPAVTIQTLFRGVTPGDLVGPYLSQFLLIGNADASAPAGLGQNPQDGFVSYGTLKINQRQRTVLGLGAGGTDFLTRYERADIAPAFPPPPPLVPPAWLDVQNGVNLYFDPGLGTNVQLAELNRFDPQRLFIRNMRDLANYVHFDALYEAYLNACLILLNIRAPFDPAFDSGNPYGLSRTQDGFGTFGAPHILSLVTEVATRALKAVWFQKWGVHRRLRPEEFSGRIHVHLRGLPPRVFPPYPGHPGLAAGRYPLLDSALADLGGNVPPAGSVLARINAHNVANFGDDTYLLPQVFPEGAPTHPAYGAGHATVAGACVTILKAFFDESYILPTPYWEPNAAGNALVAIGAPPFQLTVGGELNKLAANIALGRNAAGVHWRSDYTQSIRLGEEIAIGLLHEQRLTYNEPHHFSISRFDGTVITI